jgi:hypothetical protein
MENHPILDVPYCSLHLCAMHDHLNDLWENRQDKNSKTDYENGVNLGKKNDNSEERIYILNWLTLVGPHIGVRKMDAESYVRARRALLT